MKKIGILGGCFDPIHYGHLLLMERAIEIAELDTVYLVPTYAPPHDKRPVAIYHHRGEMARLAVEDRGDGVEVTNIEQILGTPSYTVNTVREFWEILGDDNELFLIIGGDEYASFARWKDPHSIVEMAKLVVVNRSGSPIPAEVNPEFVPLVVEKVSEVSSTNIREALRGERSIRYMTPEPVREYIERFNLYGM